MVMLKTPATPTKPKPAPRRRMTEEEFVAWCDEDTKAEWIDGEVIVASPASLVHVRYASFLLQIMAALARQHDLGEVLGPEFQVRLASQHRRRVPDVLFVAKERADILKANHVEGAPDLVIEIVSPDSLARDWREKYLEYEAAGASEYWIIDPMSRRVEVYALGEDGKYARLRKKDRALHSTVLKGFYLKPDWLWQEPLPNPLEILKELGVLEK